MLVSFECLKQMQFQLIIISQSEPLLVSFTDHSMIASVVTLRENSGMKDECSSINEVVKFPYSMSASSNL